MNDRRKRQEAAWEMLGAIGWPESVGAAFGVPITGGLTYAAYIASLANLLWGQLRETSGTVVANSGSVAASGAWTAGVGAVGQTGLLGANEAYDFDALDSKIQYTNAQIAALAAMTTQRWMFLVRADGLGEASQGVFFTWNTGFAIHYLRFESSNRLAAGIDTDGTNAAVVTDVNQVSDFIGAWRLLFMDYDDADAMGLGRRIRLFKSTPGSGVITPLTLGGGNTAATGTVVAPSTDLVIGNTTGQIRTFDGLMDEYTARNALWTAAATPTNYATMEQISRLLPAP